MIKLSKNFKIVKIKKNKIYKKKLKILRKNQKINKMNMKKI